MFLAQAQAIESSLSIMDEDVRRDRESLKQLLAWAGRFSPVVALEEGPAPSSLLIDVTGCADCFRGEESLLEQTHQGLVHFGFQVRIALADTVGAAWALAHYGSLETGSILILPGEVSALLSTLPAAALRLSSETLDGLKKIGIARIGQLMALPSSSLSARFGTEVSLRLDQAFGRLPEPLVPDRPLPPIACNRSFEYPVESVQVLHQVFSELFHEVSKELRRRCRGVRKLLCRLELTDAEPVSVELELLRPSADEERLLGMVHIKLEQIKLDGPVSAVLVRVTAEEALNHEQMQLFDHGAAQRAKEWTILTEELSLRFGREHVIIPKLVADPLPELAYRTLPATSGEPAQDEEVDRKQLRHRPLRLWSRPMPLEVLTLTPPGIPQLLRAQSTQWKVTQVYGPERLESGWWRGLDVARDYYMVETEKGARWWIFRQLMDGLWFWHGCFD
jgi:protein ImuB